MIENTDKLDCHEQNDIYRNQLPCFHGHQCVKRYSTDLDASLNDTLEKSVTEEQDHRFLLKRVPLSTSSPERKESPNIQIPNAEVKRTLKKRFLYNETVDSNQSNENMKEPLMLASFLRARKLRRVISAHSGMIHMSETCSSFSRTVQCDSSVQSGMLASVSGSRENGEQGGGVGGTAADVPPVTVCTKGQCHQYIHNNTSTLMASGGFVDSMTTFQRPSLQRADSAPVKDPDASFELLEDHGTGMQLDFIREHSVACSLQRVSAETLKQMLLTKNSSEYRVVDCRYPYEYEGGHIRNAVNLYTRLMIQKYLLDQKEKYMLRPDGISIRRNPFIFIFHCEFSKNRAPFLASYLRSMDRLLNHSRYPQLFFPELYILDGGYSNFYQYFQRNEGFCSESLHYFCPSFRYISMHDEEHKPLLSKYYRLALRQNGKIRRH